MGAIARFGLLVAALAAGCGDPPAEPRATLEADRAGGGAALAPSPPEIPSSPEAAPDAPEPEVEPAAPRADEILARRLDRAPVLDGDLGEWSHVPAFMLDRDYAGSPAGPETLVRIAWTPGALFVAFDCAYDGELDLAEAPDEGEITDLYRHDVVELFLDASPGTRETYREIEIDPRGRVLDVDVDLSRRPRGDTAWSSGVTTAAVIDPEARRFRVEARLPASAFELARLAPAEWRANVYRIARGAASRTFLARFPTHTERPSFHQPDRFGALRLQE